MSDNVIRVGDLVMAVRSCCDKQAVSFTVKLGVPHTVTANYSVNIRCRFCGWNSRGASKVRLDCGGTAPVAWLIKIKPPAISESTDREKELTI